MFTVPTLITLYYSLIYPYLSYCVEVWGGASNKIISTLFKLQRKAVRIIVSAPYKAHTRPIFDKLKILNIYNIYFYSVAMFMFKFNSGSLPVIFTNMFKRNLDFHRYNTRNKSNFLIPKYKLSLCQQSMKFTGVKVWNYITDKVDLECNIFRFKMKLKYFLLDNDLSIIANL